MSALLEKLYRWLIAVAQVLRSPVFCPGGFSIDALIAKYFKRNGAGPAKP